jgi:hypothetical protein
MDRPPAFQHERRGVVAELGALEVVTGVADLRAVLLEVERAFVALAGLDLVRDAVVVLGNRRAVMRAAASATVLPTVGVS